MILLQNMSKNITPRSERGSPLSQGKRQGRPYKGQASPGLQLLSDFFAQLPLVAPSSPTHWPLCCPLILPRTLHLTDFLSPLAVALLLVHLSPTHTCRTYLPISVPFLDHFSNRCRVQGYYEPKPSSTLQSFAKTTQYNFFQS